MKTEQEYFDEYLSQGKGRAQARNMANRRHMTDVIRDLRTNQPEKYAQLVQKTKELEVEEVQRPSDLQAFERRQAEVRRHARYRLEHSLMCCGVPLPKVLGASGQGVRDGEIQDVLDEVDRLLGIGECSPLEALRFDLSPLVTDGYCGERGTDQVVVSFRRWGITSEGHLRGVGAGSGYLWREVNFADRIPSERNGNGLYSVRLDPSGLLNLAGSYVGDYCGLLELRGKVVEHEDGVLRAEYARILCVWVTLCDSKIFECVPLLYRNYPNVPIFVCTKRQVAEALFRVVAMQGFG